MRHLLPVLLALAFLLAVSGPGSRSWAEEPGSAKPAVRRARIKTSLGDIEVELWPNVAPHTVRVFLGLADGKGTFTDVHDARKKVTIDRPFYDGLRFHRVIKNFMLQGGCPRGNGSGDAGFEYADEINARALGLDKIMAVRNNQWHPYIAKLGGPYVEKVKAAIMPGILKSLGIDPRDQSQLQARTPDIIKRLSATSLMQVYEGMGYKYDAKLPSKGMKKSYLALANRGPNTNGSQFFINLVDNEYLNGKHTVFGRVTKGMDVVAKIGDVKVGQGGQPLTPVKFISIRSIP